VGAKPYAIASVILLLVGGCADLRLGRFAPPGLVKYEDIAGDQPPNPEIVSRIEARKAAGESRTPNLSEQPQKAPAKTPKQVRVELASTLRAERDEVNAEVAADRAAADAEREALIRLSGSKGGMKLEETAGALSSAIERDEREARKERGLPASKPDQDHQ